MIVNIFNASAFDWKGNAVHRRRVRQVSGWVLTFLLHVLVIWTIVSHMPPPPLRGASSGGDADTPLTVTLIPSRPAPRPAPPVARKPETKPIPKAPKPAARPVTPRRAQPSRTPDVVRTPVNSAAPAAITPPPPPLSGLDAPTEQPQATDMMSLVNQRRDRRDTQEASAARENAAAAAADHQPSGAQAALSNLQQLSKAAKKEDGDSGVFTILSMGPRVARFSFNGWSQDGSRTYRKVFEVDAGLKGDVENAVIDKMIALIREQYSGDFSWDSHRLGHVLTLSARKENTVALRNFLKREVFEHE